MPRPKLTEEEKTAMRQRILDAAVQVLHEHGPDGLSIRAIADAVGVSHMVLYTYFDNRDALFAALHDRHSQKIRGRHAGYLARARKGNIVEVMREVLAGYIHFAERRPHAFRFMWGRLIDRPDDIPQMPHDGLREELHYLARLIELGVEQGAFGVDDPLAAAVVVMGQINGSLTLLNLPDTFDDQKQEHVRSDMINAAMAYLTERGNRIV